MLSISESASLFRYRVTSLESWYEQAFKFYNEAYSRASYPPPCTRLHQVDASSDTLMLTLSELWQAMYPARELRAYSYFGQFLSLKFWRLEVIECY